VRRAPLTSDRVWGDEDYVLSGAHGLAHEAAPRWFSSADFRQRSYPDVLRNLARSDAYPPLVYTVAYVAAKVADPILAPRWLFALGTAACATAIFVVARRRGLPGALPVTILAFCTSGLAETGADVKWSAIAPALMTACTLALMAAVARDDRRTWVLYGALTVLCLNTHYFMLSALPAHGVYVALFHRKAFRAWAVTAVVVLAVCLPWYLWALPQQTAYVDGFFFESGEGAAMARPAWKRPLTAEAWVVWLGYNVLAAFGVQPSGVRSAMVLPFAAVVLSAILVGVRRASGPVRRLVLLSVLQLAVAYLAQSLYALRFGHTTMLTWAYFPSWYPALLLSCGFAAWSAGGTPRLAVCVLGAWTVGHALFPAPDEARYQDSLDHRRRLAEVAERAQRSTVVVHRTADEARLFNFYYRGPLPQTTCAVRCEGPMPEGVDALLVLSPTGWADVDPGDGWQRRERWQMGRATVTTFARGRVGATPRGGEGP
jgi:hypothetical protein